MPIDICQPLRALVAQWRLEADQHEALAAEADRPPKKDPRRAWGARGSAQERRMSADVLEALIVTLLMNLVLRDQETREAAFDEVVATLKRKKDIAAVEVQRVRGRRGHE